MLTYLPNPFLLSRALFERIEPDECNDLFLASEASTFAECMSKCQSVDHTMWGCVIRSLTRFSRSAISSSLALKGIL